MGGEHSRERSSEPEKVEAHHVKAERDPGEKPARKLSPDVGIEMVKAQSDEGSTRHTFPEPEEVIRFSQIIGATGPKKQQENSPENGRPPSLPESASSDKGQPAAQQTSEPGIEKPAVEHSSEKAENTTPQVPLEAAAKPEADTEVTHSTSEGPSKGAKLQTTTENLHSSAESPVQKEPGEMSPCSPPEKGRDTTEFDEGSYEIITKVDPEPAASEKVEGHSDVPPAPGTKQLEAQRSAEAEFMTIEISEAYFKKVQIALLPTAGAQGEQDKGCPAVDAGTAEGAESHTASGISKKAESESPLAQQALDTVGKPQGCHAIVLISEPSSEASEDLDEADELSLMKEMEEACCGLAGMAEEQGAKLHEHPQSTHMSCTKVMVQDKQPVATVKAQLQASSGTQKGFAEGPVHVQKQEAKVPKTFYLCCSQHSIGDDEANPE